MVLYGYVNEIQHFLKTHRVMSGIVSYMDMTRVDSTVGLV